jgi:hypothetical protein
MPARDAAALSGSLADLDVCPKTLFNCKSLLFVQRLPTTGEPACPLGQTFVTPLELRTDDMSNNDNIISHAVKELYSLNDDFAEMLEVLFYFLGKIASLAPDTTDEPELRLLEGLPSMNDTPLTLLVPAENSESNRDTLSMHAIITLRAC